MLHCNPNEKVIKSDGSKQIFSFYILFLLALTIYPFFLNQAYSQNKDASKNDLMVVPGRYIVGNATSELSVGKSVLTGYSRNRIGQKYSVLTSDIMVSAFNSSKSLYNDFVQVRYSKNLDECPRILKLGNFTSCTPDYVVRISTQNNLIPQKKIFTKSPLAIKESLANDTGIVASEINVPVVAVVDTGVDYNHPELVSFIWSNDSEIPGNGIDDDGNGYIDDTVGYDFFNGDSDPLDDNGHGTHVAGIVKSVLSDTNASIEDNFKILPIKFMNERGLGSVSGAMEALEYVKVLRRRGIPISVTNNSWGGAPYSDDLNSLISELGALGIAVVVASGNAGRNIDSRPEYPASFEYDYVISVGAVNDRDKLAGFSNYGASSVDIAAPGINIDSTFPNGKRRAISGTSMAAPFVSGVLALLQSRFPEETLGDNIRRLYSSSRRVPSLASTISNGKVAQVPSIGFKSNLADNNINVNKIKIRKLRKNKFAIRISADDSGPVRLTFYIDNVCTVDSEIELKGRKFIKRFRIPKNALNGSIMRVKSSNGLVRKLKLGRRKNSSGSFENVCSIVADSLK